MFILHVLQNVVCVRKYRIHLSAADAGTFESHGMLIITSMLYKYSTSRNNDILFPRHQDHTTLKGPSETPLFQK